MLPGVKFKANPTTHQKLLLSQWMGCARVIWNAKCAEADYYNTYARKNIVCPIGTYAPIDQTYTQFKNKELTPYLYGCPSQILRNSVSNWYQTYRKFMQKKCGKPKFKKKGNVSSIYLTRELFHFKRGDDGVTRLFIGTKSQLENIVLGSSTKPKNPEQLIGLLSFKAHRKYKIPNSIYIKKECGKYTVSFCYEEKDCVQQITLNQKFNEIKKCSTEYLEQYIIGVDRGVIVPVHAGDIAHDLSKNQKQSKKKAEKYLAKQQKRLSRQDQYNKKIKLKKISNRRNRVKNKLSTLYRKIANIRQDFCHKTTTSLINSDAKIIILENLSTKNMTSRAKPKQDGNYKYLKNNAKAKSGLNRVVLDKGWHKIESMLRYKTQKCGKALFLVSAQYTSQECANCGHIHPDNRQTQAKFVCVACGHTDNADRNASLVIKKRAIKLLLHSGTELSDRGLLSNSKLDSGRRSSDKTVVSCMATIARRQTLAVIQ